MRIKDTAVSWDYVAVLLRSLCVTLWFELVLVATTGRNVKARLIRKSFKMDLWSTDASASFSSAGITTTTTLIRSGWDNTLQIVTITQKAFLYTSVCGVVIVTKVANHRYLYQFWVDIDHHGLIPALPKHAIGGNNNHARISLHSKPRQMWFWLVHSNIHFQTGDDVSGFCRGCAKHCAPSRRFYIQQECTQEDDTSFWFDTITKCTELSDTLTSSSNGDCQEAFIEKDECEEDEYITYQGFADFCFESGSPRGDFFQPMVRLQLFRSLYRRLY